MRFGPDPASRFTFGLSLIGVPLLFFSVVINWPWLTGLAAGSAVSVWWYCWSDAFRSSLILDADGVHVSVPFRHKYVPWTDIDHFIFTVRILLVLKPYKLVSIPIYRSTSASRRFMSNSEGERRRQEIEAELVSRLALRTGGDRVVSSHKGPVLKWKEPPLTVLLVALLCVGVGSLYPWTLQ